MIEFPRQLIDQSGKRYSIEFIPDNIGFNVQVWDADVLVGYACCIESSRFELADIRISEDSTKPARSIVHSLRRLLNIPQKKINYRRLGVGSSLLEMILAYAKAKGFSRVEGKIVEADVVVTPDLPDWYRKRGFIVPQSGVGEIFKEFV